jgi:hypothetical protein
MSSYDGQSYQLQPGTQRKGVDVREVATIHRASDGHGWGSTFLIGVGIRRNEKLGGRSSFKSRGLKCGGDNETMDLTGSTCHFGSSVGLILFSL